MVKLVNAYGYILNRLRIVLRFHLEPSFNIYFDNDQNINLPCYKSLTESHGLKTQKSMKNLHLCANIVCVII